MKVYSYDVAGNRLLLAVISGCKTDAIDDKLATRLCWKGEKRICDGIAIFSIDAAGIWDGYFKFLNPDGSREVVCGNALLAIARDFLNEGVAQQLTSTHLVSVYFDGRASYLTTTFPSLIGKEQYLASYDTGSPHKILEVEDSASFPLGQTMATLNINDNLTVVQNLQKTNKASIIARTFERGVNSETKACGTGATAAALHCFLQTGFMDCEILFPGGQYLATVVNGASLTVCVSLTSRQISRSLSGLKML